MNEAKEYTSFSEEVWEVLSRIDVAPHTAYLEKTSKRPEISYLPWHKAWMLCKRRFPASTFEYEEDTRHPDGTVEVGVVVLISKDSTPDLLGSKYADEQECYSRLAVMDNWMNPIPNPTARQVNDSRQRVLVKALAFAGLGLNLWGHESIPVGTLDDPIDDEQLGVLMKLIASTETNEESFLSWCECEKLTDLPVERYASARGLLEAKLQRMQRDKKMQEKSK